MTEDIEKKIDMPSVNDSSQNVEEKKEMATGNGAENTLLTIASVVLFCGIIATIICLFTIVWVEQRDPDYTSLKETVFNPSGFVTTIMVLFSSLISWSLLKVIANISLTLKDINSKLKK